MAEFVMPALGTDMTVGTLAAWLKQPGDAINRGEIIAEIDTDKGLIEVEVFTSGVIEKLLVQPGERVPVGTVMAIIREEAKPGKDELTPPTESPLTPSSPERQPPRQRDSPVEAGRLRISPAAKKLAAALGVDPSSVVGTGSGGRITREDVERAAPLKSSATAKIAPRGEPQPVIVQPAQMGQRMRQPIAAAMARSKREIPHYYLSTTIDVSRAMAWLAEENSKLSVENRLLSGVLLIKAVALALREITELNAVWEKDQVVLKEKIHVGVAISLRRGGLIAPAIHETDRLSLSELMRNLRDLVKRARAGTLRSSELSDSTITVTNLGETGVETVFGIIYPPQVALVGFGKVVERPWSVNGQIVSRPVVTATLSADHRVSDGHRGGLFLATVDRLLQDPKEL